MFVPVSCTNCGKPFQVPETALGKLAPCPWCQAVVTALPVSAPVSPAEQSEQQPSQPQPQPQPAPEPPKPAAPPQQEPLSLDDAPPSQQPVAKKHAEMKVTGQPEPARRDATRPDQPGAPKTTTYLIPLIVGGVLLLVGTVATYLALGYGSGRLSDSGWREFTAPDGTFTVKLPGEPAAESVAANPGGSVTGGQRFTVNNWYSKTSVWVSYCDIDPALAAKFPADRDRVLAAGVLQAERERERLRLDGTVTSEFSFRQMNSWGEEIHMDTPRGKVVAWLILAGEGPNPRVYVYGIEGKDVTPKHPVVVRLRDSFRVNK